MSGFVEGDVVGGDFEVVRLIGKGGMGAVYEVRQRSTGARRALKAMLPELVQDGEFRRRFEQEAQVVAKVDSEHVVSVLSAGIDEAQHVPWIAMELLKGEDLQARLERTAPLDYGVAREMFAQIGHAFEAAHAAGIVHRDLKPGNVFVCEARSSSRTVTLKVLDFGIAKVLTSAIGTGTGSMGSPLWMAPEQTMKGGDITPATDVWAYGLMAFYALTGRLYWHAPNGIGGTPGTLMREITFDPIVSASARSKELGGATLPPLFDEWFAKCLEREPKQRFQDASEAVPPLLALLESAPKRAPRAIDLMATAGVPGAPLPAASPADALTPSAAPIKTGTAFANTERLVASPNRRAFVRFGGIAIAGAAVFFATRAFVLREPPAALPPPVAMVDFGGETFTMGTATGPDDERPPTMVSVAGFALDVTEVSVASYLACVSAGRCKPSGKAPGCNANERDRGNHPINCVGYEDARSYCEWVDKRLPTENEWERAARGKSGRRYPWGDAPPADQLCWRRDGKSEPGTCPIGSHAPGKSPDGLMDMAGNVWEWTTGRYCKYGSSGCSDERRVARGGSWASTDPELVTTTVRDEIFESDRGSSTGFRCARGL